jgi:hypothetical protein
LYVQNLFCTSMTVITRTTLIMTNSFVVVWYSLTCGPAGN